MYKHNLIRTFSQLSLLLVILGLAACSGDDLTGSGPANDDSTSNTDFITNPGIISQDNFIVLAANLEPAIFAEPGSNTHSFTEVSITVKIGDKRNQRLTDAHTIYFATEWGLIDPACITVNGECSVVWSTSSAEEAPANHLNTILAYAVGEESFDDENGNFIFDDGDLSNDFRDMEEPFVDSNWSNSHELGEPLADVNNNKAHDIGDSFFNGAGCTHTILCPTGTSTTIYVWNDVELDMDGPAAAP